MADNASSKDRRRQVLLLLAAAVVALGALVALWFFPPGEAGSFWPKCAILEVTGLYCPGCGNTRALYRLIHGDWQGSLTMNPMLLPSAFALGLMLLPKKIQIPGAQLTAGIIAAAMVVFTILRNIPLEIFHCLRPH